MAGLLDIDAPAAGNDHDRRDAAVCHAGIHFAGRVEPLLDQHLLNRLAKDLLAEQRRHGNRQLLFVLAGEHAALFAAAAPENLGLGHHAAVFFGQARGLLGRFDHRSARHGNARQREQPLPLKLVELHGLPCYSETSDNSPILTKRPATFQSANRFEEPTLLLLAVIASQKRFVADF